MNMNEEKITEFLMYLENQSGEDFKKWLTGINFFEILGISSSEIRHSRMLAWLLDPKESHKLGSEFLKKFLLKVIDRNENITEVKSVDVFLRDFSDADVYRESKNNIDIFLSSPKNKFNLVIENKIFTSDHDNQLEKYRIYTEKEYPDFKNLYVYLTPNGNAPLMQVMMSVDIGGDYLTKKFL
ncbi:PD-(D/E)XK nuclease family protein [Streptococcus gallolyticus subsp. gallolyticus]|uniref:PDDEXK-like family protein n=1 Tax=Streptococcus gallolyticus TaxID=315405 RepID=UPI002283F822|nr:PD-(D/E)XK nuclease family protein [Streptococcus gallolyticus]MCY7171659.1 PD-(D/E)XK nuclease family protein [Streptococcus gallolyticus subsp. gallolyticus]